MTRSSRSKGNPPEWITAPNQPVHVLVEVADQSLLDLVVREIRSKLAWVAPSWGAELSVDESIPTCVLVRVTRKADDSTNGSQPGDGSETP